jgi:hypothetical protein
VAAVLLGQIAGPDPSGAPSADVAHARQVGPAGSPDQSGAPDLASGPDFATAPDLAALPRHEEPGGYVSLTRCPVRVGGLVLADHLRVPGWALERWDCDAPRGPWSVVIRSAGGHFGVHGAVVTFPVAQARAGTPTTRPQGGSWNPDLQLLVWPIGGSHAQIVGDLGLTELTRLAMNITVEDGKAHLTAKNGFAAAATVTYRSTVVHEMRYSTVDLGQVRALGDGLVYTGAMSGASFESQVFEARAKPAGLVRGWPAIYAEVKGRNGTLAWEPAPGEVVYIGFSGSPARADTLEALRDLADKGRSLTPSQWETKDRISPGPPSG